MWVILMMCVLLVVVIFAAVGIYSGAAEEKMLFVGDSFVGIFKLIKDPDVVVRVFPGATALGIGREENDNRRIINGLIKKHRPKCIVFNFGSVDTYLSYFYKLCQGPVDIEEFTSKVAESYTNYVNKVKADNVVVISPYYSPVADEIVLFSLRKYHVIEDSCIENARPFIGRENRNLLVDSFNRKIKDLCDPRIRVININPEISTDGILHEEFVDISPANIHLRWEPLLKIYVELLGDCGVDKNKLKNLDESSGNYLTNKREIIAERIEKQNMVL
jgi:hypothetical protein